MTLEFTVAELNTLIVFLAYTLGHLHLNDRDADNLFESAEMLRQRIQAKRSSHG